MTTIYILKNQYNLFLAKSGDWTTPKTHDRSIFSTPHKDEAINTKIELSVKEADLRITLIETRLSDKMAPIIDEKYYADVSMPADKADITHPNCAEHSA